MKQTRPFYTHEPDNRIMIKKDKHEITNWTDELEFISQELEYFLEIDDSLLKNSNLYSQLLAMRRENTLQTGALYRYYNSIRNAWECDTLECDSYYLNNHERFRNVYVSHIKSYRVLKSKVLAKILAYAKS